MVDPSLAALPSTVTTSPTFIEFRVQPARSRPFGLQLPTPVRDLAGLVRDVDEKPGVRVPPIDLRDGARQLNRLVGVEFRCKRVMGDDRFRSHEQTGRDNDNGERGLHGKTSMRSSDEVYKLSAL